MNTRSASCFWCCLRCPGLGTRQADFAEFADDQLAHGQGQATFGAYLASPRFWFESFQNWQSEFLSIAAMVWLSVYLRQRWSRNQSPCTRRMTRRDTDASADRARWCHR